MYGFVIGATYTWTAFLGAAPYRVPLPEAEPR